MDAVGQLALCRSTFDEAKAALGIPYRDGLAHRLRVASWKITPRAQREAVPLVIAFRGDGVAVDLCYDLPGLVHCELKDQCEGMSSAR